MSDTNLFSATRVRKECGDFAETTAFERYGVKKKRKRQYALLMSTGLPSLVPRPFSYAHAHNRRVWEPDYGLPRPRLARSAHRGRIKLLRGYVSKSSAALNLLTIT